jgi:hypothetical protein
MRNDYGNKPRKKLAGGKRVGKQFGGGLPIQPAVAANPMGVAAPGRRFGMKRGGKSKK